MSMKTGASLRFEPGSFQEAIYDCYIGVAVGARHDLWFLSKWLMNALQLVGLKAPQDDVPPPTEKGELRVVGIGFGRTGTTHYYLAQGYSLTLALTELGFPTLHTQHLYENEEIFQMWTDLIFHPSLLNGTAELGTPDFDVITSHGYQATCDFPMALYFDQIMDKYPDCKFILTTREDSEVWFRSWDTLTKSITAPTHFAGMFISSVQQYSIYLRWLFAIVNKDDTFLTSAKPMIDQCKEAAIESYENHNARVRELVPTEHLLEYSVTQGWEPLCSFLEIGDCPTHPFPKTNSARSVRVQAVSAVSAPVVIGLLPLLYMFAKVFTRITGTTVTVWVHQKSAQISRFLRKVMVIRTNQQLQAASYIRKDL